MIPDATDRRLLAALTDGLPLVSRPYAEIGAPIGLDESQVIERLTALSEAGVIRRLGLIVRHHELGYRANAMAVWDAPDERADELGRRLAAYPFVTLCYRRRRRPPSWPYNLFCMVHGKERGVVRAQIARLIEENQLGELPHEVLFSGKRYKQCGARFVGRHEAEAGRRAG